MFSKNFGNLLSQKIENKLYGSNKIKKIFRKIKNLPHISTPHRVSIILSSLVTVVLFILIRSSCFLWIWFQVKSFLFLIGDSIGLKWLLSNEFRTTVYQNLATVHSIVGAIILALFILVAEAARDSEDKDRARVFLSEGLLLPITIFLLTSLINYFWVSISPLSFIFPLILIALTTYSIYKILLMMLNPFYYETKRLSFLKKRMWIFH